MSVLALPAWIAIVIFLLELFRYYDWGHGATRAIILAGLLIWCIGPVFFGRYVFLKAPKRKTFALIALLFVIAGAGYHTYLGIQTGIKTNRTGIIPLDQGQNSYRAIMVLKQGVNPYGQKTILDREEYLSRLSFLASHKICPKTEIRNLKTNLDGFWASGDVSVMPQLFPEIAEKQRCLALEKGFAKLGYKYGPVLLAAYYPFVSFLGKAGIFAAHILFLFLLIFCLLFWARPITTQNLYMMALSSTILFVPFHFRHNVFLNSASDLIPTTLAIAFVGLVFRRKCNFAAMILALSTASKLLPALLYTPLLIMRGGIMPIIIFVVITLVCFSPFALWDPKGVFDNIILYNLTRQTDSTALLHFLPNDISIWVPVLLASLLLGILLFIAKRGWRVLDVWVYLVTAHGFVFLSGKIFHNNYLVWMLPVLVIFAFELSKHFSKNLRL